MPSSNNSTPVNPDRDDAALPAVGARRRITLADRDNVALDSWLFQFRACGGWADYVRVLRQSQELVSFLCVRREPAGSTFAADGGDRLRRRARTVVTRRARPRPAWFSWATLCLVSTVVVGSAQEASEASALVRQLGQFPAAIDNRISKGTGQKPPAEQRRERIYLRLRTLADTALPALQRGLTDPDVQVRRNVALYLEWEGGNYGKHAPMPLNLRPFLPQLAQALRDEDERVKALAAQALAHVGSAAAIAVPDLIRLLGDPSDGLRNSACIGLAGIGPAARAALPALRRALTDPSITVRGFAYRAIERIDRRQLLMP